ncbi:MAG TPA: serine hydrolase domain-containing protein, partial [Flavobacteriales bacterium]|nr:serine hydrolase domain-containing protein [Flavobacteriales bacterium]
MSTISSSRSRSITLRRTALAGSVAAACLLSACAPVQQGSQHCHPINAYITKNKDAALPTLLSSGTVHQIDNAMDALMHNTKNANVPGCGVAVTRGAQIVALRTYGKADIAGNRDFDLGTLSGIGSVSKTYTALGMLRLMEMGKVNLQHKATDYLGIGTNVPWANATVEDLLVHRSGMKWNPTWDPNQFHDGASIEAKYPGVEFPQLSPRLVLPGFASVLQNTPFTVHGKEQHYSNTAYTVAGAVIDEQTRDLAGPVTRRGYEDFIWSEVGRGNATQEPASPAMCMGADLREEMMPTLATGYDTEGNEANLSDSSWSGWGWSGPSGSWWVTTGDLGRLLVTLQTSAVVSLANIQSQMLPDRGPLANDENPDAEENVNSALHVGLGLELSPPNASRKWYGKAGGIVGYTSYVRIYPNTADASQTIGVALMCNRSGVGDEVLE